jgi:hypothetical protein
MQAVPNHQNYIEDSEKIISSNNAVRNNSLEQIKSFMHARLWGAASPSFGARNTSFCVKVLHDRVEGSYNQPIPKPKLGGAAPKARHAHNSFSESYGLHLSNGDSALDLI